jgi:4-aminobutyrate aminotransferase/(S)-3-amino-2-methylpropionate transaminase
LLQKGFVGQYSREGWYMTKGKRTNEVSALLKDALPRVHTAMLPGPMAASILARRQRALPAAITSVYPCVIKRGAGAMLEDVDGNIFLDWVGGVGVLNVGYSHPEVVDATHEQVGRFFHAMMNITTHEPYVELAEELNDIVPVRDPHRKTMFANSGAEAIENAVKLVRGATGRPNIIVFEGAFHGRTLLAATMTGKRAYSVGLGPFPDGICRVEFPNLYRKPQGFTDAQAIDYAVKRLEDALVQLSPPQQTAAIVLEPIQGEGGFVPAPFDWVRCLRELCDRHGILLVADEIQTGFARSGRMFVSDYWAEGGFAPDVIVMAKSLAAGLPLSAVTASAQLFDAVKPGLIGGTYGGNAVACAAALKVLEIIRRDRLCERALHIAQVARETFTSWQQHWPQLGDVRGIGSMMGLEFVEDAASKKPAPALVEAIVATAVHKGLLVESAGVYGNVIRFLCPLVVNDSQLQAGLAILEDAIRENLSAPATTQER